MNNGNTQAASNKPKNLLCFSTIRFKTLFTYFSYPSLTSAWFPLTMASSRRTREVKGPQMFLFGEADRAVPDQKVGGRFLKTGILIIFNKYYIT